MPYLKSSRELLTCMAIFALSSNTLHGAQNNRPIKSVKNGVIDYSGWDNLRSDSDSDEESTARKRFINVSLKAAMKAQDEGGCSFVCLGLNENLDEAAIFIPSANDVKNSSE
jgi:hypothetical protein